MNVRFSKRFNEISNYIEKAEIEYYQSLTRTLDKIEDNYIFSK